MTTKNFAHKGQAEACPLTLEITLAILNDDLLTIQGICHRFNGKWTVEPSDFTGTEEGDVDAFFNLGLPATWVEVDGLLYALIEPDAFDAFMVMITDGPAEVGQ